MTQRSIDEMTAEELFELARQKEQEEAEHQREAVKARVEELREQRKQLIAEHKKSLAAIDRELKEIGAKTRTSGGSGGNRVRGEQSKTILDIVENDGPISTADLKAKLQEQGIDTKNLSQQLNYLKRRGSVTTPQRAVYAIVK